jgi:hypothetical protein
MSGASTTDPTAHLPVPALAPRLAAEQELLAGLGMLTIPGIGPVVAAGWLAATAAGAVAGAATGGIIGSLFGADVSEANSRIYTEGIRKGGTVVSVRTSAVNAAELEGILDRSA